MTTEHVQTMDRSAALVANRAGSEWDGSAMLQGLCDRETYIGDAVHGAASSSSANTTRQAPPSAAKPDRATLILCAAAEWRSEPDLQHITNSLESFTSLPESGLRRGLTWSRDP